MRGYVNIQALLEYYLKLTGMNINQLADRAGISQSYLNDIYHGKKDNPGIVKVDLIAEAFNVSISEFLEPPERKERAKTLAERIEHLPDNKKELIEKMVEEFEKN